MLDYAPEAVNHGFHGYSSRKTLHLLNTTHGYTGTYVEEIYRYQPRRGSSVGELLFQEYHHFFLLSTDRLLSSTSSSLVDQLLSHSSLPPSLSMDQPQVPAEIYVVYKDPAGLIHLPPWWLRYRCLNCELMPTLTPLKAVEPQVVKMCLHGYELLCEGTLFKANLGANQCLDARGKTVRRADHRVSRPHSATSHATRISYSPDKTWRS